MNKSARRLPALARILWAIEPNAAEVNWPNSAYAPQHGFNLQVQHTKKQVMLAKTLFHYAPQPNWRLNSDAKAGHGFAIFMASFGARRPSASGAG
jgi:hypothetical protein